jgi:hypothetical protein
MVEAVGTILKTKRPDGAAAPGLQYLLDSSPPESLCLTPAKGGGGGQVLAASRGVRPPDGRGPWRDGRG